MASLNRFFKNVLAAIAHELEEVPNSEFNGTVSVANYQDDLHEAIVTMPIVPGRTGQVQYRGSWWQARCSRDITLLPGQVVYVINRRENTLYVEPGFMLRAMLPMLTTIPQPGAAI